MVSDTRQSDESMLRIAARALSFVNAFILHQREAEAAASLWLNVTAKWMIRIREGNLDFELLAHIHVITTFLLLLPFSSVASTASLSPNLEIT